MSADLHRVRELGYIRGENFYYFDSSLPLHSELPEVARDRRVTGRGVAFAKP